MDERQRIIARLEKLDMSARQASLAAGLNTHFLQKFLNNPDHSIKVSNLKALAKVLKTTPEWLLSGYGHADYESETREVIDIMERIVSVEARQDVVDFAKWKAAKRKS